MFDEKRNIEKKNWYDTASFIYGSLEQYRLLHNDQRHIDSIKPPTTLKLLFEDANPAQDHKKNNPDRDGDKQSRQQDDVWVEHHQEGYRVSRNL